MKLVVKFVVLLLLALMLVSSCVGIFEEYSVVLVLVFSDRL